jgi:hypothetical protein
MFSLKVFNEKEVLACLRKAEKRKGKRTTLGDVPSGSLVRFFERQNGEETLSHSVDIIEFDVPFDDGKTHVSIYRAYDKLLGSMAMGSSAELEPNRNVPVQLVMRPDEIMQPKKESPIKMSVRKTEDGLFHCQNYIFGMRGQHFVLDQLGFEKIKSDGREILDIDDGDCDCGLRVPGDTREYDGKTWRNDNFSV